MFSCAVRCDSSSNGSIFESLVWSQRENASGQETEVTDSSSEFAALLSYVRSDDEHDEGRITDLCKRLSAEVQMQTGEEFPIFQDREDIFAGEQWRARIRTAIDGLTLLIAIVTPSFLRSDTCREEISLFANRERSLGRDDLIIPILYILTPGLADDEDEIAAILRSRQYVDWTEYRFGDLHSNEVRRAVADLANQIIRALERSGVQGDADLSSEEVGLADDEPGFIELLAEAEIAMPFFADVMLSFGKALQKFSMMTQSATAELESANRSGKPSSARLTAIHRFTRRLEEPVVEMEELADEYLYQLARVGAGVTALVERVPYIDSDDDLRAANELLATLDGLVAAGNEGFSSSRELTERLEQNYSISSTLRPVLRRMSGTLSKMLPSEQEFERWRDTLADALQQRIN